MPPGCADRLEAFLAITPDEAAHPGRGDQRRHRRGFGPWIFDATTADGPVHMDFTATAVLVKGADGWRATIDDFFRPGLTSLPEREARSPEGGRASFVRGR